MSAGKPASRACARWAASGMPPRTATPGTLPPVIGVTTRAERPPTAVCQGLLPGSGAPAAGPAVAAAAAASLPGAHRSTRRVCPSGVAVTRQRHLLTKHARMRRHLLPASLPSCRVVRPASQHALEALQPASTWPARPAVVVKRRPCCVAPTSSLQWRRSARWRR